MFNFIKDSKTKEAVLVFGVMSCAIIFITQILHPIDGTTSLKSSPKLNSKYFFTGIENAEWCNPPTEEPLPYEQCKFTDSIFRIGVHGGLTNALHFILKGAIWAFEEDMCFFVDEITHGSKMAYRETTEGSIYPFLTRYFEQIGQPRESDKVQAYLKSNKIIDIGYHQIQYHEYGKQSGGLQVEDYKGRHEIRDIQPLYLWEKDNIWLKKHMLRRLFRIKAEARNRSCARLMSHGLTEDYIALSVRRGDKALEYEIESSMQPYIDAAEKAIQSHFGGITPSFFVASDDCTVLEDLRTLRPEWNFVSECDKAQNDENGFVIDEMKYWTTKQTDQHYYKFITELIAMSSAKFWIGVSTTNVSLFSYWMRGYDQEDDTWVFVDTDHDFVH